MTSRPQLVSASDNVGCQVLCEVRGARAATRDSRQARQIPRRSPSTSVSSLNHRLQTFPSLPFPATSPNPNPVLLGEIHVQPASTSTSPRNQNVLRSLRNSGVWPQVRIARAALRSADCPGTNLPNVRESCPPPKEARKRGQIGACECQSEARGGCMEGPPRLLRINL
jgi:hypothetical protein